MDLVGTRLTLLTGPAGDWLDPTQSIDVHRVDNAEWLRATGITDSGAVLVRPDHFIAWRAAKASGDLSRVVDRILAR